LYNALPEAEAEEQAAKNAAEVVAT